MRRFFGKIENEKAIIEDEEFTHLKTVLRGKVGEQIEVFDGSEIVYLCEIENINKNFAICNILDKRVCEALPKKNIILYTSLIKRDNLELVLSKAVELGVKKLVTFESEFATVKKSENKKDRLEKLVKTACKQCERSVPMEIGETLSFKQLIDELKELRNDKTLLLFANERDGEKFDFSAIKNFDNVAIIVGCEGGFSQTEKDKLSEICQSISLGKRILRSETASIVLCGIVSTLGEN